MKLLCGSSVVAKKMSLKYVVLVVCSVIQLVNSTHNVLVTSAGNILITVASNKVISLSYNLEETSMSHQDCSVDDVITGGIAVDEYSGTHTVCTMNNTCHQFNSSNCELLYTFTVNFNNSNNVILKSVNDTLYIARDCIEGIQVDKYQNDALIWQSRQEKLQKLIGLIIVNNSSFYLLLANETTIVLDRFIEKSDSIDLLFTAYIASSDTSSFDIIYNNAYVILPWGTGCINAISLEVLNQQCENRHQNCIVEEKHVISVAGNVTAATVIDSTRVFISHKNDSMNYISEFSAEMPSTLLSLQVFAVEDGFNQLVWNHHTLCGILYAISSDEVVKLHKCKSGLNLYLNYGIKFSLNNSEVSVHPFTSVSVIATYNSTYLYRPLFCVFRGSTCNMTIWSLLDCGDVIVNRNYSVENGMMLYSRNQLLTSQVMFVNCSLPYKCEASVLNSSQECIIDKAVMINYVSPTTIIPAGGSIINIVGEHFDSDYLEIICGNFAVKMECEMFNSTLLTCISPRLSSTKCTSILYNEDISVDLAHIGLIIGPNPIIEELTYSTEQYMQTVSMSIAIMGRHFLSVSGNQISVTVGQHNCVISSQTDNKILCDSQIPSQLNQKLTMVVMITMAAISFNKTIEYFSDNPSPSSVSYTPIIVVVVIILVSLTLLVLGAIGASFWKNKHKRDYLESSKRPDIIEQESKFDFTVVGGPEENIYESIQEYQGTEEQYVSMHSAVADSTTDGDYMRVCEQQSP